MNIVDIIKQAKKILFLACFISHSSKAIYSQDLIGKVKENCFQKNSFSLQISYGLIPKGKTQALTGKYSLYTKPHSIYSAGINYNIKFHPFWSVSAGINFMIVKNNFFGKVPFDDLTGTGISRQQDSPPIVYYKGAYPKLSVPILLYRNMNLTNKGFFELGLGCNFNFNGFNRDEEIIMNESDNNNQPIRVFHADFKSNNNQKPWIGLLLSSGRSFFLKNSNILKISFSTVLNTTKFLAADYEITIPNKPISTGKYAVTGPILQLSFEYFFLKSNKKSISQTKQ
jgi:hypothetical protein